MKQPAPVVFHLDVDNTLLDNGRVVADLKRHLTQTFETECQERYWTIFEESRTKLGYTDYRGALQRYRDEDPRDPHSFPPLGAAIKVLMIWSRFPPSFWSFEAMLDLIPEETTHPPLGLLTVAALCPKRS